MSIISEAADFASEAKAAQPGLSSECFGMTRFSSANLSRPAEYEFTPATINDQVTKAQNYPNNIDAPNYETYPAVQRFPALEGTNNPQYDVVIAGGGLLGAQTARLLAEQGKSVAVLDSDLIANGASGKLAGMGTRALDASYPELRGNLSTVFGDRLGNQMYGSFLQGLRSANADVAGYARGLPETRYGISSRMYSYNPNDPDLLAEYQALKAADFVVPGEHMPSGLLKPGQNSVDFHTGEDAARLFPAYGDRPPAGAVISFNGESRVNPREYILHMLDHPNISTFENSPISGIRTGLADEPVEVHTENGGVVRGNNFVSAIGGVPSMFDRDLPLLSVEQARMMHGILPDNSFFTRDNYFDFGNPVSRNDDDYAWWLMPKPGHVYLGADSRFLTDGDRATAQTQGLRDNFRYTFPDVVIPRGSKPWGANIYSTPTGGGMVDRQGPVIMETGGGGTGLMNGMYMAKVVRNMLDGRPIPTITLPSTMEKLQNAADAEE